MAAGYARSRPPLHPLIIQRSGKYLPRSLPVDRALDVGCGAGLSTRALQAVARHCLGIDPSPAMVKAACANVPDATFQVGCAEALPVPSSSMDLIAAAGSLNYADLDRFFPEAIRALAPQGVLLVYDFSQGSSFCDSDALDRWFSGFLSRYPMPPDSGREISPEMLGGYCSDLPLKGHERFEIRLEMSPAAYLDYVMTEVNVVAAIVHEGAKTKEVYAWCADSLKPVFQGIPHKVMFRGYIACLTR